MNYLLWSLPMLVIAGAIAIARLNATQAAALGLLATVPVAIYAGDTAFGGAQLALALERGAWIGATIAPYILGGLLFWQAAARGASAPADGSAASPADARDRRRLLFFACFLVGPFAEAATGFGVGMLGTVALLRGQRIAPRHLMVFALLSQTLIPWGAMSSGTLLASAYARMTGTELALYAMVPTAALMALVWLPLYWRTASRAGFDPHSGGKNHGAPARGRLDRGRAGPARRVHRLARPRDRAAGLLRPADHAALSAGPPAGPPRLRRDRAPHAALCRADRGAG